MTQSDAGDVVLVSRVGEQLTSLERWRTLAGPASPDHWVEHRSAFELARLWLGGQGPRVVADTLASRPELSGFVATRGVAEAQTPFDQYPGGPRNHDLLVRGTASCGHVAVSVEGKADEPFGETVGEYERTAAARRARGESTNAPERLRDLVAAIVGTTLEADPGLRDLRYQLFSGVAGALAAAGDADAVVFFVQEFETPLTTPERLARNADDLAAFLQRLSLGTPQGTPWCVGPVHVPGSAKIPSHVPLFIAKARAAVGLGP